MSLQEPSLTASLSAIDTLYALGLFNAHEADFSDLLQTLSNIRSCLKARQRDALRNSKITAYFQNTVTEDQEVADTEISSAEVIEID